MVNSVKLNMQTKRLDLQYEAMHGRYDEARQADLSARSHWQYLFSSLDALGPKGLADRQRKANRILRDDGAVYTHIDKRGQSRLWGLDPVPLLIDSEEWSNIEQGLSERAELFDLILRDLYSEQSLLKSGTIPASVVLTHPAFLRSCHNLLASDEQQLVLHSTDLVRGSDGTMHIISDRTQAPSGAGYALENRTVMSRVLPSLFRDSQVHRLALFFQALRRQLSALSKRANPRVVVLTPGAFSETYFEHSYLANYLGYALVQGSDLTVKDGFVWLKALDGLHRVDVILRRLDDVWCDPVELRGDSQLGVPGLLEVIRAGNVALANPLGSGILENPVLLRYIDDISQFLLGRKLRLQSVKTWWLGDAQDFAYVSDNLASLIVKPVARKHASRSVYGPGLSAEQLADWRKKIALAPHNYVAQLADLPSCSPSWQQNNLTARPTILRSFAVADQGSYTVMSGGLTRVAISQSQSIVSNNNGAISKDTWVLASEPQKQVSLREKLTAVEQPSAYIQSSPTELPSRVVENLFWLGRYAERAEAIARMLRTLVIHINSASSLLPEVQKQLLKVLTDVSVTYPGFYQDETLTNPHDEIHDLVTNHERRGSLANNLQAMLGCSEEVRDMLSADTHRILNDLRSHANNLPEQLAEDDFVAVEEALDDIITTLMAMAGLAYESMMRGLGWRFLELGRRTERTLLTTAVLRSAMIPVFDRDTEEQLLEVLMLSSETLSAYRRRFPVGAEIEHALPLLTFDRDNPRSLGFQMQALTKQLKELKSGNASTLAESQRALLLAHTQLQLADIPQLVIEDEQGRRENLATLLNLIDVQISQCAVMISKEHFEEARTPQQLIQDSWSQ